MEKFKAMEAYGYEQLMYFHDRNTGLKGAVCIHNTTLGPALGGTRVWEYEEEDAGINDVLRLARGMTYKAACAGLNLGGGKAVIFGNSKALKHDTVKREAFWRAFGRYVESLNGRYITAEDVGTCTIDMDYVGMETKYVTGCSQTSGDPSPFTAHGVFVGIKAACKEAFGTAKLEGRSVAVMGAGHVGTYLIEQLTQAQARVYVYDLDVERMRDVAERFGAIPVSEEEVLSMKVDVFSPCALGGIINDDTIETLQCKIIAGAANNVLLDAKKHGMALQAKGILYAPDYVINAGGLINVYQEIIGYNKEDAMRKIEHIFDRIREIIRISKETGKATYLVADEMAEARIAMMSKINSIYIEKR
ncbi:MAG: Leu/Phe/Val dehydrogenase [Erysipelotrichaceae bacterium]